MTEQKINTPRRSAQQPIRTSRLTTEEPSEQINEPMTDLGGVTMMPRKKPRQLLKWGIVVVLLVIAAGFAGYAYSNPSILKSFTKQKKFYSIFLTNGQAFFGTIRHEDDKNIILDNVFYMQLVDTQVPGDNAGDPPKTVQQPQLIKKGDEFYGPENTIRINRLQVTVIEELQENSQILEQIQERLK